MCFNPQLVVLMRQLGISERQVNEMIQVGKIVAVIVWWSLLCCKGCCCKNDNGTLTLLYALGALVKTILTVVSFCIYHGSETTPYNVDEKNGWLKVVGVFDSLSGLYLIFILIMWCATGNKKKNDQDKFGQQQGFANQYYTGYQQPYGSMGNYGQQVPVPAQYPQMMPQQPPMQHGQMPTSMPMQQPQMQGQMPPAQMPMGMGMHQMAPPPVQQVGQKGGFENPNLPVPMAVPPPAPVQMPAPVSPQPQEMPGVPAPAPPVSPIDADQQQFACATDVGHRYKNNKMLLSGEMMTGALSKQ